MPKALESAGRTPSATQDRLVVYVDHEDTEWIAEQRRQAATRGRRLSASEVVRVALRTLREQG